MAHITQKKPTVYIEIDVNDLDATPEDSRVFGEQRVVFRGNGAYELRFDVDPESQFFGKVTKRSHGPNHEAYVNTKWVENREIIYYAIHAENGNVRDPKIIIDPP